MQIEDLLRRPGLAPEIRILVATAVAIWRAEWPQLQACATVAQALKRPRQDLEETLLQAVLFCGFPRVVTAFEQFGQVWPAASAPRRSNRPEAERRTAGDELFATIYGGNEASVRAMLRDYHEELHDFVLDAAYGRILTRPQLAARTREIIAVALLAAQGQTRQFVGHARGAMHLGASKPELREALVTTFGDGDGAAREVDAWYGRLR